MTHTALAHPFHKAIHLGPKPNISTKIPYFAEAILEDSKSLSMNLQSISLGDPTINNFAEMESVPLSQYMHEQNSVLGIPQDILSVFDTASSICGYDRIMQNHTYPPPISNSSTVATNTSTVAPRNLKRRTKRQSISPQCATLPPATSPSQVFDSIFSGCFGPCGIWDTANNYLSSINPW